VNNRHGLWNADNPANWVKRGGIDVTPGVPNRGERRVVRGRPSEQYGRFCRIRPTRPSSRGCRGARRRRRRRGSAAFCSAACRFSRRPRNINLTSKFTFKFAGDWQSSIPSFRCGTAAPSRSARPIRSTPLGSNYPSGFVGIDTTGPTPVLAPGSPYVITVPGKLPGKSVRSGGSSDLYVRGRRQSSISLLFGQLPFVENLQGSAWGWDLNCCGRRDIRAYGRDREQLPGLPPTFMAALNNGTYHVGQLGPHEQPGGVQLHRPAGVLTERRTC